MVGVPGRSKACQACKKRRVACDLQVPACTRCVRNGRQCQYATGHIFIMNDSGSHKSVYRKTNAFALHDNHDQYASSKGPDTVSFVSPVSNDTTLALQKKPQDAMLMQQALLARAFSEDKVFNTVMFSGIIKAAQSNGIITGTMHSSFLACYTAWLGRKEGDPRLAAASHEFYAHALKETHAAIASPRAYTDATLAACNALGIYEALECPGKSMEAYYWHRSASVKLVWHRGPEAHQDGAAHQLFTNFRLFGILHAMDNKVPTFLASDDWLNIPWTLHSKTIFDELIDIFTLGPGVLCQAERLPQLPPTEILPAAISILGSLSTINAKLDTFYSRLQQHYPKPLYWEQVTPTRSDQHPGKLAMDDSLTFPPLLAFHDLQLASTLTLYWALLTMVWSSLGDLYGLFEQFNLSHVFTAAIGESNGALTPQTMQFLWLDRARKVCQSVAFCTTPSALETSPPRIATQLAIIIDVLKNRKVCEAEYTWALQARKMMGAKWLSILSYDP